MAVSSLHGSSKLFSFTQHFPQRLMLLLDLPHISFAQFFHKASLFSSFRFEIHMIKNIYVHPTNLLLNSPYALLPSPLISRVSMRGPPHPSTCRQHWGARGPSTLEEPLEATLQPPSSTSSPPTSNNTPSCCTTTWPRTDRYTHSHARTQSPTYCMACNP